MTRDGHLMLFLFAALFLSTSLAARVSNKKRQAIVADSVSFPCDTKGFRSPTPPTSVHQLRPGDIDVVGAIGDSLTAGTGATARTVSELIRVDNRGVSWSGGGQGTWREYLTVPNILKEFNPAVYGYALGDGRSETREAKFNVAVSGAMDQDMIHEAKALVRRMKADPKVDMDKHWKLISVNVGTNDICSDFCHIKSEGPETHRKNLQQTLDYLYQHLPRTFVNLVTLQYVPSYMEDQINRPPACFTMLRVLCSCLFGVDHNRKLAEVKNMTRIFQDIQKELIESGRYDRKEDFTVVLQPTFTNGRFLTRKTSRGRRTDYSYISVDCLHYSQRMHAMLGNSLWNNMLEPQGNKTSYWTPEFKRFLCPNRSQPYFFTGTNSKIGRNLVRRS